MHIVVIGGGAAGFFGAITAKAKNPLAEVILLERSAQLLSKVRISGGGRCNVTHACFEPAQLIHNYPRGNKALLGPFTRFQPRDTIAWFEERGVQIKQEEDGRMFPITDNSQTIIDCLLREATKLKVDIRTQRRIATIDKETNGFRVKLESGEEMTCDRLLLATGSHPQGHRFAEHLGHTIQSPVPSLFTFNVPQFPLKELAGISLDVKIHLVDSSYTQEGPLLITHWGFSGPAALKLSAWAARLLHEKQYHVQLRIDWLPDISEEQVIAMLDRLRREHPNQALATHNPFGLPKNLWKRLVELTGLDGTKRLSANSNDHFKTLSKQLKAALYTVDGKTTHKEEFVTCGGITLDEVNFKTMESKRCPGLFFAGEILDIDAVTGGFNFQNAWTTGWLAGNTIAL